MLSRRTTVLALCGLAIAPLLPRIAVAQEDWQAAYRQRIKLAPLSKNSRNALITQLHSCTVHEADQLLKRHNIC